MTMVNQISNADLPKAGATGLCEGANLRTPCGARRIESPGRAVEANDVVQRLGHALRRRVHPEDRALERDAVVGSRRPAWNR